MIQLEADLVYIVALLVSLMSCGKIFGIELLPFLREHLSSWSYHTDYSSYEKPVFLYDHF